MRWKVSKRCLRPGTLTKSVLLLLTVLLNACNGAGNWQSPAPSTDTRQPVSDSSSEQSPTRPARDLLPTSFYEPEDLRQSLMLHYGQWEGVPYRFGGDSKSGIDCSAFVQQTFRTVVGLDLPRTTRKQAAEGYKVEKDQAQSGDLVFFKTGRALNHVGVYLGEQKFMHSSKSRGVVISRLDDRYWQPRIMQFRRYLTE